MDYPRIEGEATKRGFSAKQFTPYHCRIEGKTFYADYFQGRKGITFMVKGVETIKTTKFSDFLEALNELKEWDTARTSSESDQELKV